MKKKVLSLVLSASMVSSMLPAMAYAADGTTTFPDMPNDWSTTALQSAIDNGLLNGIDGKIAASENLTRAQMAAIVTRAFGTNGNADISGFGDVNSGDWFYNAMAAAVNMGAFQGDGTGLNPNANITRQEAFTVLARLFTLSGAEQSVLNSFSDAGQVADWAKDSMASMVQAGYVSGDRNMLKPTSSITRAEFAQVMYNLLSDYMVAGEDGTNVQGNAILNQTGTLSNVTVSGDLIIGDGAGEGDVTLNNVTVSGRLLVRGGGVNTVTLEGNTTVGGQIVVNKPTGDVRVHNSTSNEFDAAVISDGATLTGEFDVVEVTASGTTTVTGATVNTVNVSAAASLSVTGESKVDTVNLDAASSKLNVNGNSTVTTVNVPESASNASIDVANGSTVTNVNTAANGVSIDGEGKVSNVKVEGNNTSVDTVGTKVTVASGVTGTTSNGKDIAAGTTVTTTANGTTGGGSTGGSSGGDSGDDNPIVDEKEAIENVEANFFSLSNLSFNEDNKIAYTDFEKAYRDAMGSNYTIDNASLEKLEGLAEDGTVTRADIESVFVNLPWVGIQFTTNEPLTNVTVSYTKDGKSANFAKGNGGESNQATDVLSTSPLEAKGYVVSYVIGDGALTTDAQLGYKGTDAYGTYVFTISGTTEDGDLVTVASQSVTYRGTAEENEFVTVNFETEGTMNPVEIYVGDAETVNLSELVTPSYTNGEYLFQKWTVDGYDTLTAVKVPENKTITVTAVETKVENAEVRFRKNGLWDATKSPYATEQESFNNYNYAGAYEAAGVSVDENGTITVDEAKIDAAFVPVQIDEADTVAIAKDVIGMINYNRDDANSTTPLWVAFGVDKPEGATKYSISYEAKVDAENAVAIAEAEVGETEGAITYENIGTVDSKTGVVTLGEEGELEAAQYIVFYNDNNEVVGANKLPAFNLKVTPDAQKTADVENLEQLNAAVKDSKVETINLVGDIDFANTPVEVPEKITVVVPAGENVTLSSTTEEGVQTNALTKPGLTVHGVLEVQGELTVAETAGLQVEGTATVAEDATLVNKGEVVLGDNATLTNNGTLTNDGTLDATVDNVVNNGTVDGKVTTIDRMINEATIHDTSETIADGEGNLFTSYDASAEKDLSNNTTTITIAAEGLKKHWNGDTPQNLGYWVGAFLPAPDGTDWNKVQYRKGTAGEFTGGLTSPDFKDDNGEYLSYYVNAGSDTKTFDFYVAWDGNTENAEHFVLNVEGVTTADWSAEELLKMADYYKWEDHTDVGTTTIEDKTINYSAAAQNFVDPGEDGITKATADLARYLGALYQVDNETTLSYDGTAYTWDVDGDLKGSNWIDKEDATLVSAITKAMTEQGLGTSTGTATFTLTVNDTEVTVNVTISDFPGAGA